MPPFIFTASCAAGLCDYAIYSYSGADAASCMGGSGSCANARMLSTTTLPNTHDGHLQGASRAIQAILNGLAQHANGRELAFLNMGTGVMLGWVTHNALTAQVDPKTITDVLQLVEAPAEEPAETGG